MKLTELLNKITPLPWRIRSHPEYGKFVEGPAPGRAYAQQILGDDYGDEFGEQKEHDPVYVVHAANVLPQLVHVLKRVRQEDHCTPDIDKLIDAALARATEVKS